MPHSHGLRLQELLEECAKVLPRLYVPQERSRVLDLSCVVLLGKVVRHLLEGLVVLRSVDATDGVYVGGRRYHSVHASKVAVVETLVEF